LRNTDRGAMERPAVTEQDDVADCLVDDQPFKEVRPLLLAGTKIDCSRQSPKFAIAAVEIDPMHVVATASNACPRRWKNRAASPHKKRKPLSAGAMFKIANPLASALPPRHKASDTAPASEIARSSRRVNVAEPQDGVHEFPQMPVSVRISAGAATCRRPVRNAPLQSLDHLALRAHVIEASGPSTLAIKRLLDNARALLMPSFAEGYGYPVARRSWQETPMLAADLFCGDRSILVSATNINVTRERRSLL
jgi:hypothetical protein